MKRQDSSIFIGGLIIVIGVVALLQNGGVFGAFQEMIWIALFGCGGIAFLAVPVQNPARWWGLIPGMIMLSIAGLMFLDMLSPSIAGRWGGSVFLGGLSLAFWGVFVLNREAWWALIPAGVISTLAVVAGVDQFAADELAGATLFLGIALTFGLVYLVRRHTAHTTWALIVAGGALLLSVSTLSFSATFFGLFWPAVLIVGGLMLLLRSFRHPNTVEESHDNATLPQSH